MSRQNSLRFFSFASKEKHWLIAESPRPLAETESRRLFRSIVFVIVSINSIKP